MVGRVGFEPTTNGLKGHCSTTELPSRYAIDSSTFCLAVNSFFQRRQRDLPCVLLNSWAASHCRRSLYLPLTLAIFYRTSTVFSEKIEANKKQSIFLGSIHSDHKSIWLTLCFTGYYNIFCFFVNDECAGWNLFLDPSSS